MRTLDIVEIDLVAGGARKSLGAEPVETSIHHAHAHKKVHEAKARTHHAALHQSAKTATAQSSVHVLSESDGDGGDGGDGDGGDGGDGDGDGDGGDGGDSGDDEGDTDESSDGNDVGSDGGLGGDVDTGEYGDSGNFDGIGDNETGNDVAASDPDGAVASQVASDVHAGDYQSAEATISSNAQSVADQAQQGASASPDLSQGFQDLENAGIHGVMAAAGMGLAAAAFDEGNIPSGMMLGAQALDNAEKAINEATTANARAALEDIVQSIEKTFSNAVPQS